MNEELRVLQVEDSESDAALNLRVLSKAGYEIRAERVETAGAMREALARAAWDVIIADYHLPQFDAAAALTVLQESGLDIPFIVVSATIGEVSAVAMMKSGASDYLLKDNLARLVPVVEREIREARSRSERRLLQEQFLQAQKLESIGLLAGAVAHDFNNLLTVITGYSQMALLDLPRSHPLRDSVEEISKAADRAGDLTRQLLTFSRRQPAQPKEIDVNDLLRQFEKILRRLIGEEQELILELAEGAGIVRADPGHLEQVIMNLAVNAKDAMPKGGKLLIETSTFLADEQYAHTHLAVSPGRYVLVSVSDNGCGMSAEVRARIFEPFFTTKEQGKGTGLGLSTVYGIVKQSGGSISVYSEPGQGTCFRMLFPAIAGGAEPLDVPVITRVASGNETILVAEDDAAVRKYVSQVLGEHGYRVLEASNGREALEAAANHSGVIHLFLADSVMPEVCGEELIARFAAIRPGVPVVCMSGYSDRILNREPERSHCIQKPFPPATLLVEVRTALDAHHSASGL